MLWGVVTGMVHCGVVLRWPHDVHPDDAPRKVPEAFRGAVRWGGVGEEYRSEVAPSTRQIHQAMQPISHMRRNQASRVESSHAKPNDRLIAHRVDHSLFATTSSKQQAASGQAQVHVHVHVHVRVEVEVEVEASCGQESITNHRGEMRGNGSTGQSMWELTT